MARGGRIQLDKKFVKQFEQELRMTIQKVGRGTKKATIQAAEEILDKSLQQVPLDYAGLAASAFIEVSGNYRTGFQATVGYGGNGDPVNPRTGKRASEYMVVVHEDLKAEHEVGKSKFLEDPINEYKNQFVHRSATIINDFLK